jgi:hypothetical protein
VLLSEETNVEQMLRRAMPLLGFRKHLNLNLEDGRALVNVFVHGVKKTQPSLTFDQGMEIIMDLATSGEDYGWPEKLQRGFFTALRAKFGRPTGSAAIDRMFSGEKNECDTCGGGGIAILPKKYAPGAAACICTKGRYLLSCWVKNSPNALDLVDYPHIVELINEERSESSSTFKGNIRDAIREFGGIKSQVKPQQLEAVRPAVRQREAVVAGNTGDERGGSGTGHLLDIPF